MRSGRMEVRSGVRPDSFSPAELSRLIGAIYDCALDPNRWEETLVALAGALDCKTAALSLIDLPQNRLLVHRQIGSKPHEVEEMRTKYMAEINAWVSEALRATNSLDEPFVVSRDVPADDLKTSPYYQEGLRPIGLVDGIQYFLMATRTRFAGLGFIRDERQGLITQREIELGNLLLPHVRRAVTISNVLEVQTIERARMAETLDTLRCGVVLTDEHGAILHANRAAELMLKGGLTIRSSHGAITAKAPSAAAELREAIKLAGGDDAAIGKTGIAIRLSPDDLPPRFAHVLPLNGGEFRPRLHPDAAVAVFIGAAADHATDAEIVAEAYGLTPAETRLLAGLLAGQTLAKTAGASGIALTTAKSHLESVFSKTGATRQAELMLLVPCVTSPARLPQD